MKRKTRLSKGTSSRNKSRLASEALLTKAEEAVVSKPIPEEVLTQSEEESVSILPDFDADVKPDIKRDQREDDLGGVLDRIKADVSREFASLKEKKEKVGEFLHEAIYLDSSEHADHLENVKVVERLMGQHRGENLLIKVQLHDEPEPEAGLSGLVRAEDFLNFEHLELSTPDGDVYTIPRTSIREVVGVMPQSASIDMPKTLMTSGGFGTFSAPKEEAGGSLGQAQLPNQASQKEEE